MSYVDGFVIVVKKKKLNAYFKMAARACKIWKELGALQYFETVGDDLNAEFGLPFPKLVKLKEDEAVVFSWVIYESKAQRNAVNKKIMKDPRMAEMCDPKNPPFEMKRMSYGGFKVKVS